LRYCLYCDISRARAAAVTGTRVRLGRLHGFLHFVVVSII